ncbi:hypothetical protein AKO1_003667 [Acrasis kona]|uniref:Uncharacterized protein n=1 Tax=Acrasis kona TaxID=1008807 RepID=A0AAW2Z6C4_9EUKA
MEHDVPKCKTNNFFKSTFNKNFNTIQIKEHNSEEINQEEARDFRVELVGNPENNEYDAEQSDTHGKSPIIHVELLILDIPQPYRLLLRMQESKPPGLIFKSARPLILDIEPDGVDLNDVYEYDNQDETLSTNIINIQQFISNNEVTIHMAISAIPLRNKSARVLAEALDSNGKVIETSYSQPFTCSKIVKHAVEHEDVVAARSGNQNCREGVKASPINILMKCRSEEVNPIFLLENWNVKFGAVKAFFVFIDSDRTCASNFIIRSKVPPDVDAGCYKVNVSVNKKSRIQVENKCVTEDFNVLHVSSVVNVVGPKNSTDVRFTKKMPEPLVKVFKILYRYAFTRKFVEELCTELEKPKNGNIRFEGVFVKVARRWQHKYYKKEDVADHESDQDNHADDSCIDNTVITRDAYGRSIAHYFACIERMPPLLLRMLFNHAQYDPDEEDHCGRSALYWAECNNCKENVKIMTSPKGYLTISKERVKVQRKVSVSTQNVNQNNIQAEWNDVQAMRRRYSLMPGFGRTTPMIGGKFNF